jgi:DNA-binding winged helix-turn-helix (wHTH) protein
MKMPTSSEIFLFGEFRLDRDGGGLFRRDADGIFVPVAVGSRALEILAVLVERQGEIVPKEEIIVASWPRTMVAEGNLFVQIAALRRILDAAQSRQSCIQTVIGRGYRFVAPVTRVEAAPPGISSSISDSRGGGPEPEDGRGALLAAGLPAPDKPSIAVLPFANLSGDPEQEYFADGMVGEIITALSRIRWLFVLARNSSFTYKGQAIDVKRAGANSACATCSKARCAKPPTASASQGS